MQTTRQASTTQRRRRRSREACVPSPALPTISRTDVGYRQEHNGMQRSLTVSRDEGHVVQEEVGGGTTSCSGKAARPPPPPAAEEYKRSCFAPSGSGLASAAGDVSQPESAGRPCLLGRLVPSVERRPDCTGEFDPFSRCGGPSRAPGVPPPQGVVGAGGHPPGQGPVVNEQARSLLDLFPECFARSVHLRSRQILKRIPIARCPRYIWM